MTKLQLKYRELKIISVIAANENISHAGLYLASHRPTSANILLILNQKWV
ncbi:putative DNA-binding transcriptional regulator domain protein [Shigella flexneri 6603-63]|nr:putative DNA-binding transcriptional regulator domain protein [Shigella flexneri 6603-63]